MNTNEPCPNAPRGFDVELVPLGWCVNWQRCRGVAVPAVRQPGHGETCLLCLCHNLGLPEDTPGEDVLAELKRRASEVGT